MSCSYIFNYYGEKQNSSWFSTEKLIIFLTPWVAYMLNPRKNVSVAFSLSGFERCWKLSTKSTLFSKQIRNISTHNWRRMFFVRWIRRPLSILGKNLPLQTIRLLELLSNGLCKHWNSIFYYNINFSENLPQFVFITNNEQKSPIEVRKLTIPFFFLERKTTYFPVLNE